MRLRQALKAATEDLHEALDSSLAASTSPSPTTIAHSS